MSRSRQKGTTWEAELLPLLRSAFQRSNIERAGTTKGTEDAGDYVGLPETWMVEAKSVNAPAWKQWLQVIRRKATKFSKENWMIAWHGDRRTVDGQPVALMPLELALELIALGTAHGWPSPIEIVEGLTNYHPSPNSSPNNTRAVLNSELFGGDGEFGKHYPADRTPEECECGETVGAHRTTPLTEPLASSGPIPAAAAAAFAGFGYPFGGVG